MRYSMAKKPITYDIVEVVWIDAEEHGEVGWNDLKEQLTHAKKPCPTMTTVGYLVYDGKDHISLLSTQIPLLCLLCPFLPTSCALQSLAYACCFLRSLVRFPTRDA